MSVNSEKKQKVLHLELEPRRKQPGNCISNFTAKFKFFMLVNEANFCRIFTEEFFVCGKAIVGCLPLGSTHCICKPRLSNVDLNTTSMGSCDDTLYYYYYYYYHHHHYLLYAGYLFIYS